MEKQEGRLDSIDALRGFDMLFIFIAGLSFPFSMSKQLNRGRTKSQIAWRSLRRLAALVLLGLVCERFFMGEPARLGNVLTRIGISWACASWMFLAFRAKTRAAMAMGILLGYWAINLFVPAPGFTSADVFTPQGNIACWLDWTLLRPLGRISPGTPELPFDNQGLLSTLPAIVTAMLGMFTGEFVRWAKDRVSAARQTTVLFAAAAALVAVGCFIAFGCGRWSFPISKPLWSPSFTLIMGGYSVALFALFHWLIVLKGWWRNTLFFRVVGLNAITIYIAQPLFSLGKTSKMLFGRFAGLFPDRLSGLAMALCYLAMCWALLWFLHKRKIYLKV